MDPKQPNLCPSPGLRACRPASPLSLFLIYDTCSLVLSPVPRSAAASPSCRICLDPRWLFPLWSLQEMPPGSWAQRILLAGMPSLMDPAWVWERQSYLSSSAFWMAYSTFQKGSNKLTATRPLLGTLQGRQEPVESLRADLRQLFRKRLLPENATSLHRWAPRAC